MPRAGTDCGVITGVTELEATEDGPVPAALVAVSVKVYTEPLVRPVTGIGLVAPVAVILPGLDFTVYKVIGLPFDTGAWKETVAAALPTVAETPVGAPGTVNVGVTLLDGDEAGPMPAALVAVTVKV